MSEKNNKKYRKFLRHQAKIMLHNLLAWERLKFAVRVVLNREELVDAVL